ncbi:hypothetical protein TVD_06985 [Thioalkalivibrio versutus]|uniref:Chorismatase FkbO/Hyg5-like N-terminal domain-containing protein n=1 Tax=Thioalkalivibrio versutus TaxID=106634 RepID=A0A0G3G431_9GAMM|nr:hypothetical protein [Thioalkalivibrio versutus]AKJ95119.1 hypothetical protein TVD_06985 [Thioalkalivibrio versutus]
MSESAAKAPLTVTYCRDEQPECASAPVVIRFGGASGVERLPGRLEIRVGLEPLGGESDWAECWSLPDGAEGETGVEGSLSYLCHKDCLIGCWIQPLDAAGDPDPLTERAYREILAGCRSLGFEHLVRVWNYLPAINDPVAGQERYRGFCSGRARVFEALPEYEQFLPAATAIGTHSDGLLIYFIATREAAARIENPRQVSAYHYPPQYGPRSPSFARASLWQSGPESAELFISGTASIVGHESRHVGDLEAQIDESLRNVGVLLEQAATDHPVRVERPRDLSLLKVYLRHAADASAAERHLRSRLGHDVPCLLLHGDICREELLVEIEGLYSERLTTTFATP